MLVVANGCTDGTAKVAASFAADCPQVKLIDIPAPIGKGGAVLAGFRQAEGQYILFADADAATAPDSLFDLLAELKNADVAIGSRWLDSSVIYRQQPLQRRVFSRLFNASVHHLLGCPTATHSAAQKPFVAQLPGNLLWSCRDRVGPSTWTYFCGRVSWVSGSVKYR